MHCGSSVPGGGCLKNYLIRYHHHHHHHHHGRWSIHRGALLLMFWCCHCAASGNEVNECMKSAGLPVALFLRLRCPFPWCNVPKCPCPPLKKFRLYVWFILFYLITSGSGLSFVMWNVHYITNTGGGIFKKFVCVCVCVCVRAEAHIFVFNFQNY